jgi:hypothetical protein
MHAGLGLLTPLDARQLVCPHCPQLKTGMATPSMLSKCKVHLDLRAPFSRLSVACCCPKEISPFESGNSG